MSHLFIKVFTMSRTITLPTEIANKLSRKRKDFRLDFFRAGGKGGQKQNKTSSGVRITDLVTGISAEGRDERKRSQNQSNAFYRLVDKLVDFYSEVPQSKLATEVIRSYREIDGRVVDHQTGLEGNYSKVLDGDLDKFIDKKLLNG